MSRNDNRMLPDITFVEKALPLAQLFLSDPDKCDSILIQIKRMGLLFKTNNRKLLLESQIANTPPLEYLST